MSPSPSQGMRKGPVLMSSCLYRTVLLWGRGSSCSVPSHLQQYQNLGTDLPAPYGKLLLLIEKVGPQTWFQLSSHSYLAYSVALGTCLAFLGLQVVICEMGGVQNGPSSPSIGGRLVTALCRIAPCWQAG